MGLIDGKDTIKLTGIKDCLWVAEHMIMSYARDRRACREEYAPYVRKRAREYLTRVVELECWHPPIVFPWKGVM